MILYHYARAKWLQAGAAQRIEKRFSAAVDGKIFAYTGDPVFNAIVPLVVSSEGRFANLKGDPGGPTMFGIAFNYNQGILKQFGIIHPMDVQSLTLDEAKEIYYEKYWLPSGGNKIPAQSLGYIHFDAAVNCGVGQAAVFLSRLSAKPESFKAGGGANQALWKRLFLEYLAQRLRFYTRLKNRANFLDGWVNRMCDVITRTFSMES